MPLPLRGLRYYVAVRKGQFDCGGEREATCIVTVWHWDMTRGRFVVEQVLAAGEPQVWQAVAKGAGSFLTGEREPPLSLLQ